LPPSELPTEPHLIGYARVSTDDQNPRLQIDALVRAGVPEANIYVDVAGGSSLKRENLHALLKELRAGDTVVIWKFDRLSRSLVDLLELIRLFHKRGARFRSLTEAIDTSSPMGEFFLHVLGSFAQFERAMIRERTRAGLARSRAEGRVGGRRPTFTEEQIRSAKALRDGGKPWGEAAASIGISVTRLQARIRELCQTN
jgi:DNA invertase Pin-like site-specific DNA recombinase